MIFYINICSHFILSKFFPMSSLDSIYKQYRRKFVDAIIPFVHHGYFIARQLNSEKPEDVDYLEKMEDLVVLQAIGSSLCVPTIVGTLAMVKYRRAGNMKGLKLTFYMASFCLLTSTTCILRSIYTDFENDLTKKSDLYVKIWDEFQVKTMPQDKK